VKSPVREAFQILVQDGFINTAPNAGFVVSALSKDDVREIFEIRVSLEGLAGRLAVKYISNSDIERLTEMVEQSKTLIANQEFDSYWKFNRQFHISIYELCGNKRLYNTICDLYSYSNRYPSITQSLRSLKTSIKEHYVMLDVYSRRDEDEAERAHQNPYAGQPQPCVQAARRRSR
jgi:DNA-binding GntR family transcriptional regulator